MSIRLRRVRGTLVALCAAKTIAQKDDKYLDDEEQYALSIKFWRDNSPDRMEVGVGPTAPEWAIMEHVENIPGWR